MKNRILSGGAKTWYFPDGFLPNKNEGSLEAHEAIMIMNVKDSPATIKMDIYFEKREPIKDISFEVAAERVLSLRMDDNQDTGGFSIPPLTQYAVRLRSTLPVIAMFGRLDTTQNNMAYYTVSPYSE